MQIHLRTSNYLTSSRSPAENIQAALITALAMHLLSRIPFALADRVDEYVRCMKDCVEEARLPVVSCDAICGKELRAAEAAGTLTPEEKSKFLRFPTKKEL